MSGRHIMEFTHSNGARCRPQIHTPGSVCKRNSGHLRASLMVKSFGDVVFILYATCPSHLGYTVLEHKFLNSTNVTWLWCMKRIGSLMLALHSLHKQLDKLLSTRCWATHSEASPMLSKSLGRWQRHQIVSLFWFARSKVFQQIEFASGLTATLLVSCLL